MTSKKEHEGILECPFCNAIPEELESIVEGTQPMHRVPHKESCFLFSPYGEDTNIYYSKLKQWNTRPSQKVQLEDVEAKTKELYYRYEKETGGVWVCRWEELAQHHKDFDMYLVREASKFGRPEGKGEEKQ